MKGVVGTASKNQNPNEEAERTRLCLDGSMVVPWFGMDPGTSAEVYFVCTVLPCASTSSFITPSYTKIMSNSSSFRSPWKSSPDCHNYLIEATPYFPVLYRRYAQVVVQALIASPHTSIWPYASSPAGSQLGSYEKPLKIHFAFSP